MKKTCNRCRALYSYGCSLGYKTTITTQSFNGHQDERKPLENCPKPMTYESFFELR